MANKKISELTIASLPLTGAEVVPIVQDGETRKVAVTNIVKKPFSTIANLKASSDFTTSGSVVDVSGYYAIGDGGGGKFYWDATNTETDNGGTIIQVTGIATGRWIRIIEDVIDAKYFGVVNSTDTTLRMQEAVKYAKTVNASVFKCVGFSDLNIKELLLDTFKNIEFDFTGTTLNATQNATLPVSGFGTNTCFKILDSSNVKFKGLELNGNSFSITGIAVESSDNVEIYNNKIHDVSGRGIVSCNTNRILLKRNKVYDNLSASVGIVIGNNNAGFYNQNSVCEHNEVYNCQATGIAFQTISGNCSYNKSYNNQGSGIITTGAVSGEVTDKVTINGNECFGNLFQGIQEDTTAPPSDTHIVVVDNICYENDVFGIAVFQDNNWIISNNVCYDNGSGGTSAGIRIEGGKGISVNNNTCYNTTGQQKRGISLINFDGFNNIENLSVNNNMCYDNTEIGISIQKISGTADIKNFAITGNVCTGNTNHGIREQTFNRELDSNGIIANNVCYDNGVDIDTQSRYMTLGDNSVFTSDGYDFQLFTDLDTTPKVKGRTNWRASYSAPTVISNFIGQAKGHKICFYSSNSNVTLTGNFMFKDGTNSKAIATDVSINLWFVSGKWREI